jgi:hypothetical protein
VAGFELPLTRPGRIRVTADSTAGRLASKREVSHDEGGLLSAVAGALDTRLPAAGEGNTMTNERSLQLRRCGVGLDAYWGQFAGLMERPRARWRM